MRCTVKDEIDDKTANTRCTGVKQSMMIRAICDKGHQVAYTDGAIPIVFCMMCGAFAWRRAYGLAKTCPGRPTPAGAQALSRIRRGMQPWHDTRKEDGPRRKCERIAGRWCPTKRKAVEYQTQYHYPRLAEARKRQLGALDGMHADGDGDAGDLHAAATMLELSEEAKTEMRAPLEMEVRMVTMMLCDVATPWVNGK